jgi:putative protease
LYNTRSNNYLEDNILKYIELLAPAGSKEAFYAAVNNGADAVYLGGKIFNARQFANNFSNEDLKEIIAYAHFHGVKVYITVNTLIADTEIKDLLEYLVFLRNSGVDAIITQDLGVAKLVKEYIPDLELHASTQMTIHNSPGVQFLKEQGFKRVVLSRECSLEDIKNIHKEDKTELEVFIHGALCICYSGQCYMSSMIGGRSGNRGKCAQPCRLGYELMNDQGQKLTDESFGKHLLSPKDLNTSEFLIELLEAGVTSLKIEGRMKRPEYVATVVRIYRQILDQYYAHEPISLTDENKRDLKQIFNRDFTSGYFIKNQGADLMSYKKPNNRGIFLGRVQETFPQKKYNYN